MRNLLRVDFKRFFMTPGLISLVIGVPVGLPFVLSLVMYVVGKLMHNMIDVSIENFMQYTQYATIFLAIFVTVFIQSDIKEGIFRNKLISGKNRTEIMFSYIFVNAFVAFFSQIISVITCYISSMIFHMEITVPFSEVIEYTIITTFAGVAISTFFTVIYLCICAEKIAMILPAVIAIIFKIVIMLVVEALYPESGVPTITGTKLAIFTFIDKYVALSYLVGAVRWEMMNYVIGCSGLIIISVVLGVIIFNKRDTK